jgi:hypothetical protein
VFEIEKQLFRGVRPCTLERHALILVSPYKKGIQIIYFVMMEL